MVNPIQRIEHENGEVHYMFWCPGCSEHHAFDGRWAFNGDMEKPTFSPSLLVRKSYKTPVWRCHSFVRNGTIEFLHDSSHHLAGQTVELGDVDDW